MGGQFHHTHGKYGAAFSLLALLLTGGAVAQSAGPPPAQNPAPTVTAEDECLLEAGPLHSVVAVLDAETLQLDDGSQVRLIGALAPRLPGARDGASPWLPEQESVAQLTALVSGRTIELAFHGRRKDRYGRALAHVFAGEGKDRVWVQGELLAGGHARAYVLDGSKACFSEMLAHEAQARVRSLGLWRHAAYQLRDAGRTRELMRYRSSYQLVAGTVTDVVESKGRMYINFGRDWREDFTLGIDAATVRANKAWAEGLKVLKGRRVVVRGWIERRNGPFIEVTHPLQIESDVPQTGAESVRVPAPGDDAVGDSRREPSLRKKTRPVRKAPGALDL